jgi:cell division protein FtsQ
VQYGQLDSPPPGLPHFAVPTGTAAAPTGQAVATVAAALSAPVLAQLAEISAANPQAITLVLRDGRTVLWGTAVRSQQKAALLPALLGQPGTHFDVSNPELAIVR